MPGGWPEQLLATYAIILIITDLVKWAWGGAFLSIPRPEPFTKAVFLFGFPFPSYNFFVIIAGGRACNLSLVAGVPNTPWRHYPGSCPRSGNGVRSGNSNSMALYIHFVLGAAIAGLSGQSLHRWVSCLRHGY